MVADVLDLYAESYSVVSTLAGAESTSSEAVEKWYKEANETRGWGIYDSSENTNTEDPAEEPSGAPKPGSPPLMAKDEPEN